jgi:hypothetical protein
MGNSAGKPIFLLRGFPDFWLRKAWVNSGGLTGMINWSRALLPYRLQMGTEICVYVSPLLLWGKKILPQLGNGAKSIDLCDNGRLMVFENASNWVQVDDDNEIYRELVDFFP